MVTTLISDIQIDQEAPVYDEISLDGPRAQEWVEGYVEDPRRHKHLVLWTQMIFLGVWIVSCLICLWLGTSYFETSMISLIGQTILASSVIGAGVAAIADLAMHGRNRNDLLAAGLSITRELYFLKVEVPSANMDAYDKAMASGFFYRHNIRVIAPLKAFRRTTPIDPIIFGIKDGKTYFITQWGIEGVDLELS